MRLNFKTNKAINKSLRSIRRKKSLIFLYEYRRMFLLKRTYNVHNGKNNIYLFTMFNHITYENE